MTRNAQPLNIKPVFRRVAKIMMPMQVVSIIVATVALLWFYNAPGLNSMTNSVASLPFVGVALTIARYSFFASLTTFILASVFQPAFFVLVLPFFASGNLFITVAQIARRSHLALTFFALLAKTVTALAFSAYIELRNRLGSIAAITMFGIHSGDSVSHNRGFVKFAAP